MKILHKIRFKTPRIIPVETKNYDLHSKVITWSWRGREVTMSSREHVPGKSLIIMINDRSSKGDDLRINERGEVNSLMENYPVAVCCIECIVTDLFFDNLQLFILNFPKICAVTNNGLGIDSLTI